MLGKIVVSANVNNEDKFFFVLLLNFIRSISILDHKRRMLYLNTLKHFTILCVLIRVLAGILQ